MCMDMSFLIYITYAYTRICHDSTWGTTARRGGFHRCWNGRDGGFLASKSEGAQESGSGRWSSVFRHGGIYGGYMGVSIVMGDVQKSWLCHGESR